MAHRYGPRSSVNVPKVIIQKAAGAYREVVARRDESEANIVGSSKLDGLLYVFIAFRAKTEIGAVDTSGESLRPGLHIRAHGLRPFRSHWPVSI